MLTFSWQNSREGLYSDWLLQPQLWKRYIDDIIVVWQRPPQTLQDFVSHLNTKHPTIKFTYEHSQKSIDFLDVTFYKGPRFAREGILDIKPFFKHTNKFQYLQYSSAHPRNTFRSIVKGEFSQLLRACSDPETYEAIQHKMIHIFRDRGYPKSLLENIRTEVPFSKRNSILYEPKEPTPYDTFMVVEYTPDLDVRYLSNPTPPNNHMFLTPVWALKRPRQTLVIESQIKGRRKAGLLDAALPAASVVDPCPTRIRSSPPIITKCSLSQRVAGHRAACKHKTHLPLYKHFTGRDHDFERDITISIVEKTTESKLLERERHLIDQLETTYPKGLNSKFDLEPST